MRYVMARYEEYQNEMAYRIYISDRLYKDSERMIIPADARFYDWIKKKPKKEKSGDDIAAEVIAKAGLVVR